MHHFVNTTPEREEEEPEVESSDDLNDDEEWARMGDIGIIYHAKNLAGKKLKRGRPGIADKRVESEDSEDSEDSEEIEEEWALRAGARFLD